MGKIKIMLSLKPQSNKINRNFFTYYFRKQHSKKRKTTKNVNRQQEIIKLSNKKEKLEIYRKNSRS